MHALLVRGKKVEERKKRFDWFGYLLRHLKISARLAQGRSSEAADRERNQLVSFNDDGGDDGYTFLRG